MAKKTTSNGNGTAPTPREGYWRKVVGDWEKSSLSQARFCSGRGITRTALGYWRRELRLRDRKRRQHEVRRQPRAFLPVQVVGSSPAKPESHVEIELENGRKIRIGSDIDPAYLRTLVEIVGSTSC